MIVLESERLLFRDHEPADLDAFCDMEADPEVRRYVGGAPRTREVAERKFQAGLHRAESNRLMMWAAVYKPEARYIGRCGVYPHFMPSGPVPGEGALGFYLARAYWGRGLATEAGRAFVNFGFHDLGLSRIVTAVEIGNDASIRVLEKLGFALVRTENGESRSFYHFELNRPPSPDRKGGVSNGTPRNENSFHGTPDSSV
jgi:ribosomal-protein-alanine N-acetyltransferase